MVNRVDVRVVEPVASEDNIEKLRKGLEEVFDKCKSLYGDRRIQCTMFVGAPWNSPNYPATTGWTKSGRIFINTWPNGMPSEHRHIKITEDWIKNSEKLKYLYFLTVHELTHNYTPPESVVPYYLVQRLMKTRMDFDTDRNTRTGVIDVLCNNYIMTNDKIKNITGYTGKDLVRSKFLVEKWEDRDGNIFDPAVGKASDLFEDYHYYYYNDKKPRSPIPEIQPLFDTYFRHKKPFLKPCRVPRIASSLGQKSGARFSRRP